MTIKELREEMKNFPKGSPIIFPLSVFEEEDINKLIKEGILVKGDTNNILDYKIAGVKE